MKRRDLDDMDDLLVEWGEWYGAHGVVAGFGGGREFTADRFDMGPRQVGTHSDPLVAEVLRELAGNNTRQARIHRLLLNYSLRDRILVRLRFVGIPTRVLMEAQGYDTSATDVTIRNVYTGMLPFEHIPEHANKILDKPVTSGGVQTRIRQVKKWLHIDMMWDRAVRAGLKGNEGNIRAAR